MGHRGTNCTLSEVRDQRGATRERTGRLAARARGIGPCGGDRGLKFAGETFVEIGDDTIRSMCDQSRPSHSVTTALEEMFHDPRA